MADTFDKETRTEIMKKVKSNNNKSTELKLIEYFKNNHITGWKRHYKVFGKPDFVFHKYKIAIFVDGCFWHGHDCRNTRPESNKDYWDKKISRNMKHDTVVTEHLQKLGWKVIRIWECEFKKKNIDRLEGKLLPLIMTTSLPNKNYNTEILPRIR